MPSFHYKAKQKDAQSVSGQILARDREDAIEKINQLNLIPVYIEEAGSAGYKNKGLGCLPRLKPKVLYSFSRQLVHLLKGGIPILRALEIIAKQQKDANFRDLIQSIHLGIREGRSFSDCLSEYPQVFTPLYAAMVKAGEESGSLKETIQNLAEYFRERDEITAKVQNAMIYPAMMALLGTGSVIFILTYVLPKLTVLYNQFGQRLPGPTLFVVGLSHFLVNYWLWLALILVCFMGAANKARKSASVRLQVSRWKLQLPLLGPFLLKVELMRFCSTLELLLSNGVSIVRAIQFAVPVVENELLRTELKKCQEILVAGSSFAESLKGLDWLPDTVGYLIAVGEESGNITGSLQDIADNYRQETEDTIKILMTLLEPLLIVVVGAVIGFIVIAMLLPIFQLDMLAS